MIYIVEDDAAIRELEQRGSRRSIWSMHLQSSITMRIL